MGVRSGGGGGLGGGGGQGGCERVDVNEEFKFLRKFTQKIGGGGGGRVGRGVRVLGGGGQGRCERKIEVFVKIHKKKLGGGSGVGSGSGWGGGGRVGGVRVDVNEELKCL